jgi:formylglycine-generating enzyme required for sulfatase activity
MKTIIKTIAFCFLTSLNLQAQTNISYKPEVILVEGGTFSMGSNVESDETPHSVILNSYSLGKYPVTVGQYKQFCNATNTAMPRAPGWGWQDKHPIVNVNYNDALSYCHWLGENYGGEWHLPTEAQWEFAARGGNKSKNYKYSGSDDLDESCWYKDNAEGKTQTVGSKKSNELGFYDMSGNIWEWCLDWYGPYEATSETNPNGPKSGSNRVLRGGSWFNSAPYCRLGYRNFTEASRRDFYVGFRVVLSQ